MQPKLLQLPLDIHNAILKELMPQLGIWFPRDWDSMWNLPVPLDLCRLLAVCRAFHELASPWVWRRVAICLRDEGIGTGTERPLPRLHQLKERGKIVPGQWNYLRDHPETASHIRLLTLDIRKGATLQTLTAFQAAMGFMTKLQVLRWKCGNGINARAIEPIYLSLVSKECLHRIIASGYTPPDVPWNIPSTTDLTHLKVQGWKSGYEHLLVAAPCLQSLGMAAERGTVVRLREVGSAWETLSIPWGTLRKITLKDFPDCFLVFHNLAAWKQSFPTRSAPLSEVTINISRPLIPAEDVELLTRCGQDLRALHLGTMRNGDYETFFNRISAAFPRLQKLAIFFCSKRLYTWDVQSSTVRDFFRRLPLLKRLDCNYLDEHREHIHEEEDDQIHPLEQSFKRTISAIRPNLPALEQVNFHEPEYFTSYELVRDRLGRYRGCTAGNMAVTKFPELFMSLWDDQTYDRI